MSSSWLYNVDRKVDIDIGRFSFFVLRHVNLSELFNAKSILVEKFSNDIVYPMAEKIMAFMPFPKGISLKQS